MQSYRNPKAQWLGSPNFSPNRNGHDMTQPSWIVIHTMVGSLASANSRFQQSSQQASATYGVSLKGEIVQWVDEGDGAWANGATGRGGKGDNLDSISIEHEDNGDYNGPRTPELYAASAWLVHDICQRYAVPIDRAHVIGHRECDFSSTACPDALDVNRIVAAAAAGGTSSVGIANAFTEGDVVEIFHLMQSDIFGVIDPTGQAGFVNAVRGGVSLNAIGDAWRTMPQARAYQAAKEALIATEGDVAHLKAAGDPAAFAKLQADIQAVLVDLLPKTVSP